MQALELVAVSLTTPSTAAEESKPSKPKAQKQSNSGKRKAPQPSEKPPTQKPRKKRAPNKSSPGPLSAELKARIGSIVRQKINELYSLKRAFKEATGDARNLQKISSQEVHAWAETRQQSAPLMEQ